MMEALGELSFARMVIGVECEGRSSTEITEGYGNRYLQRLAAHQQHVALESMQGVVS